jgi:hypothetical protein
MASPFEQRVPVAAELKVVAMRVGEMVGEMETITVEMVEAEEETGAVVTAAVVTAALVTTATAVAEMVVVEATVPEEVAVAVADTAVTVERKRGVVTVVVTEENTDTTDRNPLL